MDFYPIKFPRRPPQDDDDAPTDAPETSRPKRVRFREPDRSPVSENASLRNIIIPDRSQFLRDWPHPPHIRMTSPDDADPFPLFNPLTARYFDQSGDYAVHPPRDTADGPPTDQAEEHTENHQSEATECGEGDVLCDKRFAYSLKGAIKDYFFAFKPLHIPEEQENLELSDQINRQILHAIGRDNSDAKGTETVSNEADGWDENSRSPGYWKHRRREVEYFVNNDLWSVDPIGEWSYLNTHKVPRHFLRRLRRYFQLRPLEYLRDTGSYRMFHVLNQYHDLQRLSPSRGSTFRHALKMEVDYLVMVWLAIWDPRLQANVWQLQETAMTDWFLGRTGWGEAVGVGELVVKNEVYAMENLWEYRGRMIKKEEPGAEEEELEEWGRSGVSEAVSSRFE